jgi:small subunit ribosomal protein S18
MSEEIKNIDTDNTTDVTTDSEPETAQVQTVAYEKKPYINQDESGERYQRNVRFKRKVCRFCHDKNAQIDYKDVKMVEQFITDRGKILPRRVTGICAKHQRGVALAIKRARIIALIPFVEK